MMIKQKTSMKHFFSKALSGTAKACLALALCMASPQVLQASSEAGHFEAGKGSFMLNGKPFVVKAAEMHYPRIPRPYWEHRIQMCKALGMNTVCLYVFWNIHEQEEGKFDFTGNNDVAEFCRLAQKNGMYVIVRPGPYVCAEWEMGGLPWWLLKKKDINLRHQDPYFMERVRIFEQEVGKQLAPLTIQNGGPIIMVQVENEYGSYGNDKPYVMAIRDCLREIYGKELALFQCDWSSNFEVNGLEDLTWTMNFGTGADIDQQFKRLGEVRPDAPKMCSEFWSGWFDKWGAQHETRNAKDMVDGMEAMLKRGISFSLYMTHGGTSFGHWAGANSPGFAPDVTSYDYDAPINEYGKATEKFYELRTMMARYNDGKKLPSVPKLPMPTITVPRFELTQFTPLFSGTDSKTKVEKNKPLLTFEEMDLGWGMLYYATRLPRIDGPSVLTAQMHDYAQVFINGRFIGKLDRVKSERTLNLPAVKEGDELEILVEGMGRVNFGQAIKDYKGIVSDVVITAQTPQMETVFKPRQWNIVTLSDSYERAKDAFAHPADLDKHVMRMGGPAMWTQDGKDLLQGRGYYRGTFNLKKVGDTFLNFQTWGKGQVYVNGHELGRIWSVGPQQTLYCPGCWLKKGENEVIVLDIIGPKEAVVWGQDTPELNMLQIDKPQTHRLEGQKLDLSGEKAVMEGTLKAGNGWQEVKFSKPVSGRYFCIEALNSHWDREYCCISELYLLDEKGNRLSREPWSVAYADDEDVSTGNKNGTKVFDLQESTYWSTNKGVPFPHHIIIDLNQDQTISGFQILPRMEENAPESIKDYRIYVKSGAFKM